LYFKVSGSLTWFSGDETRPFYYLACQSCKKKVIEEANGYRCENCQKSYSEAVPTFNFSFRFSDFTSNLYLSCLGETGDAIIGIPAANFYQMYNENPATTKMICQERLFTPFTLLVRATFDPRGGDYEGGSSVRYMAARVLPENIHEES
jgi:replication factor A1